MMVLSRARAPLSVKTNQAIKQLEGYVLGCVKSWGIQRYLVPWCALEINS